jgi:hypothetical protein
MKILQKLAAVLICIALGSVAFAQGFPPAAPAAGPTFNAGGALNGNALGPAGQATSPTAITSLPFGVSRPEIGIAEAAGTLTDPTDFIYLSKEFVFNLLVLASSIGVPGVQFNANGLPTLREVEIGPAEGTTARTGPRPARPRTSSSSGEMETVWVGGSSNRGQRTVRGAQTLAAEDENVRTMAVPADEDAAQMLNTVTVTNNEDFTKLKDLVKDMPGWQRVGRLPLQTTQKQKIDKAIAGIYAQAFRMMLMPGTAPSPQGAPGPGGSNTWVVDTEAGASRPQQAAEPQPGQPYQQGPPPIDPQAMGEWYYFDQQAIAWERYINEEVLMLKPGEPANFYNLDTAVQPQELYLAPQDPNAPLPIIHFDNKETPIMRRLSAVKPASIEPALDQLSRTMEDLAAQNAKKDSDRSRVFVANLDARKERRFRYREWLNDQTTEIHRMAEDYRRRLAGNELVIDGVQYLVSQKPLGTVPLGSRNIVTERLTPYDLLDTDGTLKKATEASVEQTP